MGLILEPTDRSAGAVTLCVTILEGYIPISDSNSRDVTAPRVLVTFRSMYCMQVRKEVRETVFRLAIDEELDSTQRKDVRL